MRSTLTSILIAVAIILVVGGGAYLLIKKFSASADTVSGRNPDLNSDGKVNVLDLNILVKAVGDKSTDQKYDLNNDSKVDSLDIKVLNGAWKN